MKSQNTNHFYSHLLNIEPIKEQLKELDITADQHLELITIIESNLHYTILDIVLSNLTPEDKKQFLHQTQTPNHKKTWEFLHNKIVNIEKKLTEAIEEIQKEIIKDIRETQKKP